MLKKIVLRTAAVPSLIVSTLPASAEVPSKVQVLIDYWHVANLYCRGSSDPKVSEPECDKRDNNYGPKLDRLGWCYGTKSEMGALAKWHRCTRNSERYK